MLNSIGGIKGFSELLRLSICTDGGLAVLCGECLPSSGSFGLICSDLILYRAACLLMSLFGRLLSGSWPIHAFTDSLGSCVLGPFWLQLAGTHSRLLKQKGTCIVKVLDDLIETRGLRVFSDFSPGSLLLLWLAPYPSILAITSSRRFFLVLSVECKPYH